MYKLIIVDDELIVRRGLQSHVDWTQLGFQVVGTFSCGDDAINYLKDNPVDAVISDIRMNNGDGLALSEWIHINHPGTSIVLLTGYTDYDAACRAVSCGSIKYLLNKPVPPHDVATVFLKIRNMLDQQYIKVTQQNQIYTTCLKEILRNPQNAPSLWNREMAVVSIIVTDANQLGADSNVCEMHSLEQPIFFCGTATRIQNVVLICYPCSATQVPTVKQCISEHYDETCISEYLTFFKSEEFSNWLNQHRQNTEKADDSRISAVNSYIDKHIRNKILLKDVSDYFHYSEGYFCRVFKEWTGISFSDYLNRYRLEQAKRMLVETNDSIQKISLAIGIDNVRYFSFIFRKSTGMTPSEFRQNSH